MKKQHKKIRQAYSTISIETGVVLVKLSVTAILLVVFYLADVSSARLAVSRYTYCYKDTNSIGWWEWQLVISGTPILINLFNENKVQSFRSKEKKRNWKIVLSLFTHKSKNCENDGKFFKVTKKYSNSEFRRTKSSVCEVLEGYCDDRFATQSNRM